MAWGGDVWTRGGPLRSKQHVPSILVIVQNLPVPLDRRVWLECQALVASGYHVSVICPQGPGDLEFQTLDGVDIYKYAPPPETTGAIGYVREFVYCWWQTAKLSRKVWQHRPFDVMQACNPPDTYWALAVLWRRRGVRFVYDQHDLNPELFRAKFGRPRGLVRKLQHRMLVWLERKTYQHADHVIATNESYRLIALTRGERDIDDVTVVRSGPDTARMRPVAPVPALREGAEHLVCYLGIMGSQDGVDYLLHSVRSLVHDHGRVDTHFALLGFGESQVELQRLADELEVADWVTFTGRADPRMISEYLSTADLGLCPDPRTVFNDCSTMNKIMEYMAYALPVVAYDLHESKVSAGDAAAYVAPGDTDAFAKEIQSLLDDPVRRAEMSAAGRRRVAAELDWAAQAESYVGVYDKLLGRESPSTEPAWPVVDRRRHSVITPLRDEWGHELIDLRRVTAPGDFLRGGEAVAPGSLATVHAIPHMRAPLALGILDEEGSEDDLVDRAEPRGGV